MLLSFLLPGFLPAGAGGQEHEPLFETDGVLSFTLRADFRALRGDRGDDPPERPGTLILDGEEASGPLRVLLRTRGHFRRRSGTCSWPPLRLRFREEEVRGTVFEGQDRLKLVVTCRPSLDRYEVLVLREYLAYRIYRLVEPRSFRVRLARIRYVDESGASEPFTRFGFLIEDDDDVAARSGGRVFELPEERNLPPAALEPVSAITAAVFQYMIGNADWSAVAGHNVTLVDLGGIAVVVPYDFDFSGFVDAPYATPPSGLGLSSVRERVYRGWCRPGFDTGRVLERFRRAETGIRALIQHFPLLDSAERTRLIDYLEPFFDAVRNDERAQRLVLRDCRTG